MNLSFDWLERSFEDMRRFSKWQRFGRRLYSDSAHTDGASKSKRTLLKLSLLAGGTGYAVYSYRNYRDAVEKESVYDLPPYKLVLYRTLPLAGITAAAGVLASLTVPEWLRGPLYGAYAKLYGCDMSECAPYSSYSTFNHFFTRKLNSGIRPLASSAMTSPADGKVIAFGRLDETSELYPEQVKGVRYPLKRFLGTHATEIEKRTKGTDLYYCSVYLAPGSYHRFHSPVDGFQVKSVDRIAGEVLPVAPWVMNLIPGLVSLNERAVISGRWAHGQLHMVPVGATNVRSISLKWPSYKKINERLGKGQEIGQFEMGSLVVLVFEAPKDFTWKVEPKKWIKYGEALGDTNHSTRSWWWPFF